IRDRRDRAIRAEQDELQNRPTTGTGVFRCLSRDGRRIARDKHDIRLGEFCGELTSGEVAKIKAEANRPPTKAEQQGMSARAAKLSFNKLCVEAGRVLRKPDVTPKGQYWEAEVLKRARIPDKEYGYIRERRMTIGLQECSVL